MDESNSWEVNIFLASQEIACNLWYQHVHYCVIEMETFCKRMGRHKLHLHHTGLPNLPNHIISYEIQILFIDNGSNRDTKICIMVKILFIVM